ncbi:MAG: hypothetical protein Q8N18_01445 [Opitutaceae bacterium]|nr:hypothetical protein [Opitutaceae bacterium]
MNFLRLFAFTAASLLASSSAFAALIGATVTGTLQFGSNPTNFFSPGSGFVPAGYLNSSPGTNTVVISGSANEFGFGDGFTNPLVANFSDTQLIINTTFVSTASPSSWVMTFSSSAFSGASLSLINQTYNPGLLSSLVGNLITITWAGGGTFGPNMPLQATYNIGMQGVGVPDSGSTGLMFAGALLIGMVGLRRLKLAR